MAINLQELRSALVAYVDSKVTVTISALVPSSGASIGPNEEFTFSISARNADAASGGIALKDVVWRAWVQNDAVAKLIVPPVPMVARSGPTASSPVLTAGSQVREMYLFPGSDFAGNYLSVGDTDSISLRGKAGSSGSGGSTNVQFKIYADPDMDWLFPKDQDSSTTTRALNVIG